MNSQFQQTIHLFTRKSVDRARMFVFKPRDDNKISAACKRVREEIVDGAEHSAQTESPPSLIYSYFSFHF